MAAVSQTPNLDRLGLQFQRETPDGNCWFYAVARQLYGDVSQAGRLRAELATYFDQVAADKARSEQFVFPNGMYDVNVAGQIRYANRNVPLLGLKKGEPILANNIYDELTQIVGFRPPAKGEKATPQEIAQAYADSLRRGMFAGDIESSLIQQIHGVVIRIYTRKGKDVVHTRTFDAIPNWAPRPDFYRQCFPPECINLLYNGINHYDSLVRDPARIKKSAKPAVAVDPDEEAADALGMSVSNYKRAIEAQKALNTKAASAPAPPPPSRPAAAARPPPPPPPPSRPAATSPPPASQLASFTRKKRAVLNAIKSYAGASSPAMKNIGSGLLSSLNANARRNLLRRAASSVGMPENALVSKFNTTAGGSRKKPLKKKRRNRTRKA